MEKSVPKSIPRQILDFRIDIDEEFQGWILLFATLTAIWLFCLPCYCAGLSYVPARRFASFAQQRLPCFYVFIGLINFIMMSLIIQWLPAWTFGDYIKTMVKFMAWLAKHLLKFATSIVIIVVFCFGVAFKERIALMLGLDHQTLFKCKFRDCLHCWSGAYVRPIELYVWKVEDLSSADFFSANNVFVEFFLGHNEPMRTRVHNNAGSSCLVKETMQLNFDEDDDDEILYIFVRNQKVMGKQDLGRAEIHSDDIKKMLIKGRLVAEDGYFKWEKDFFENAIPLVPRGKIWLRMVPVHEEEWECCF